MSNLHTQLPSSSRLRVVFSDAVVMLKLADGATYGDVAALWDDATGLHDGATVAIAVTVDPSLPLATSWMYPPMSGAPSLRNPLRHAVFRRPTADTHPRNLA